MSKQRMVNTRFWIDDYISNLDPIEKLLFLYFLTNPMTDICGVYEIPLKSIAMDTGIDKEMVEKITKRFERDGKIFYESGWVGIKNFAKHQLNNPSVKEGIKRGLESAPKHIVDRMGADSTILPYLTKPNLTKLNLTKPNDSEQGSQEIPLMIDLFKNTNPSYKKWFGNKTQRAACSRLLKNHGLEKLTGIINALPSLNRQKYCPVITTPLQLEDKFAQLHAFVEKLKANQHPNI